MHIFSDISAELKKKNFSNATILFGVGAISVFIGVTSVLAAFPATKYAPGETLNPACGPTDTNCGVEQIFVATSTQNYGIGTTSPYARLSVVGEIVGAFFTGTTTATSTFGGNLAILGTGTSTGAGGFNLSVGCFAISGTCIGGPTSAAGGTGAIQFANGTSFAGDINNFFWDNTTKRLGIGTSTPSVALELGPDKSLRITGGTSFPGTPSEGQIFYRTDSSKLYTYANSKWQGDRTTATIIVAATDSQNKEKADYVADGTNDEVEINAAIAALPSTGGLVYLLDGTYNIGATITIAKSNVSLTGSGDATILKRAWNETVVDTSGVITVGDNGVTAFEGIKIDSIKINGDKTVYTNANNHGILFKKRITSSEITNSWIDNGAGSGIYFITGAVLANANKYNLIEGNQIKNNTLYGIYFNWYSNTNNIVGNVITGNAANGVYIYSNSEGNTINTNVVESNLGHGVVLNTAANNSVVGNTVRSNSGSGIFVGILTDNSMITGNQIISNAQRGIFLQNSSSYTTISGNNISGSGEDGIILANSNKYNSITGNVITNSVQHGINLSLTAEYNVVSNNNIYNSGGTSGSYHGIMCTWGCSYNVITSNRITDTAGTSYAIVITPFAGSFQYNNYLADNYYSGTGAASILDNGTDTIFGGQYGMASSTPNLIFKPLPTGNFGIGTTSPYSKLAVWGRGTTTSQAFEIANSASTTLAKILDDGTSYFYGNVGIGTTTPYAKLSVVGEIVGAYFTGTTTATSTLGGYIDVNGASGTSTVASNLWVKGTLRAAISYVGDLVFSNNFRFVERDLLDPTQALYLNNQFGTTTLAILDNGNIGIGTTTPIYKLHVMGDVAATGFINTSTRDAKKDIVEATSEEGETALTKIRNLFVAHYRYNAEDASAPLRTGLIAEEAPTEVLSPDGKGVDLYKFVTFLASGMKALVGKVDAVVARVAGFEDVFTTKKLCLEDVCVTKTELQELLILAGSSGVSMPIESASPIVIQIQGNNPATINVGDIYGDLGAIITAPLSAQNLGIRASLDGDANADISQINVDTSVAGVHHIVYSVIDQNNVMATAERILNVVSGVETTSDL